MSAVAVFMAGVLYAEFVRERRGHLVHDWRHIWAKAREKSARAPPGSLEEREQLIG
jgi:hypothetical protein